ncbi:MAG: hypothetical protein K6T57_11350 [Thermaceae bacterium]|nr:hypothetical protein [Thermaceae bacterium]
MRGKLASWFLLGGILAACGGGEPGSGGDPPPAQKTFTVSYTPAPRDPKNPQPTDFYIPKVGGSVDLTITVNLLSSETQSVRFIFSSPSGIAASESNFVINGSSSKTIRITAPANLNQPYFTIQATGQDSKGSTRNQYSTAATFTWKPQ